MNHEMVNNRISQLPIAMAGLVHAFSYKGRSLSVSTYTLLPFARRCLP
ncbi:hypothetical protein [Paenibacillus foliorum]|nr:hypothetical protein [Paenibacillus foliorum]